MLARAGFERTILRPPTGKRWDGRPDSRTRKRLAGFEVRAAGGNVSVIWRPGSSVGNLDRMVADRNAQLRCYARTITGAGWTVKHGESELIVTAGKAGQ